jgi:thiamine-phosphate pyrophosphorylase
VFEILVVTDPAAPRGMVPYVEALRAGGGDWALLVRDHDADDRAVGARVEDLLAVQSEVPILLAAASVERVVLASDARLAGVHLAERGPSVQAARALLGGARVVGASVHDRAGAVGRGVEGVDYFTLAPFGEVPGKGRPLTDREIEAVTDLPTPTFALGAIRSARDVTRAIELGCRGIALRSWFATADDGAAALMEVRSWLRHARETRPVRRFSIS